MAHPPINQVQLIDPSELFRPEKQFDEYNKKKAKGDFRVHDANETVRKTYTLMHTYQTLDFVKAKIEKWGKLCKARMSVMEALSMLDALVDESDPDVSFPNSFHAYQTAERIREAHPDKEWFHLVGLLHDIGKVMALWGEPQWCVMGDTFPLGCKFSEKIVFADLFANNPDTVNPLYSSKNGIYEANCGLDNVTMSWGHDEYMYLVLKGNDCKIPDEGLYMIKYHSFYPWHTSGEYYNLCSDYDIEMLQWIREFSKFDLYSKSDSLPDVAEIKPYYESLIAKYCPGVLRW